MMRHKSLSFSLLTTAAALLFSGAARAELPAVVTDIPALGALVQQVMGDLGQPEVLLESGGDPHHYQLRPSQARSLQSADLLVWIGPELSPWLARPAEGLKQGVSMPMLALPGVHLRSYGEVESEQHDHDHDHGHDHGHDHDHAEDGHDHSGLDPHAWLDPENGKLWLSAIAETLAARDPDHAETYRANAAEGIGQIDALDARLATMLEPAKGKQFVTFHDAYGYFTEHYGLKPGIAVSLGDASAPSAARLREIRKTIEAENALCAFPEINHDPKLLHVAIEGTAAQPGQPLDPEGSKLPSGAALYGDILESIGNSLATCLTKG